MPEKKIIVERERTWNMKRYPRVTSCRKCLTHEGRETPATVCRLFIPVVIGYCERHFKEFRQYEHDMTVDFVNSLARILDEYHTCLKAQIAELEVKKREKAINE